MSQKIKLCMNFKDLQSSTCQLSPERIVLVGIRSNERPGFYFHRGLHWIFLFSHSKVSDANIDIIANFV